MHLDTRTISIIIIITASLLGLAMLMELKRERSNKKYIVWGIGNGSLALGWLLLTLRGVIPDFASIVIANTLISLCHAFLLNGVQRFFGIPRNWYFSGVIVAAVFFGQWYWIATEAPVTVRIVYVPSLLALHASLTAWYLFNYGTPGIISESRKTGFVFLALCVVYVSVALSFIFPLEKISTLFESSTAVAILFLGVLIGVIGWTIGFLSMINASNRLVLANNEQKLQEAHDGLEIMVEKRTQDLSNEIAERKQVAVSLRAAMQEAKVANKTKTDFMSNMSHELRTPLNAIIGFSETMKDSIYGPLGNEQYEGYAEYIHSSGTHLLQLINDILDVSAVEAGKLELREEEINIVDACEAAIRIIAPKAQDSQITLGGINRHDLPILRADPRRLKQVFINLIYNAVKFTPEHGSVSCDAVVDNRGDMVITIRDTGVGMDEEGLKKALAMFGQVDSSLSRTHEGTGLGIPLTKGLVELHGGTLKIESEKGHGTLVKVTFPKERVIQNVR